jgi:hypothetical protein
MEGGKKQLFPEESVLIKIEWLSIAFSRPSENERVAQRH